MTIIEYAPYFLGEKFIGTAPKDLYRATETTLQDAHAFFSQSITGLNNVKATEDFKQFCESEPDLANKGISKSQMEEYYYGLKFGKVTPVVPAKTLYLAGKVLKALGSLNYMCRVLPKSLLNPMFSKGHVAAGSNLLTVLNAIIDPKFKPLSDVNMKVQHGDFYDVFLEDQNNVIMVPSDIGELLSDSDISSLRFNGVDVVVGDTPLRFLSNHIGAVASVYDYRGLI